MGVSGGLCVVWVYASQKACSTSQWFCTKIYIYIFFGFDILLFFAHPFVFSSRSTTLDWVHGLQPEDLEKFLAEKKEQRMRVLCLDLEPTGIPQQVRTSRTTKILVLFCVYVFFYHFL